MKNYIKHIKVVGFCLLFYSNAFAQQEESYWEAVEAESEGDGVAGLGWGAI